MERTGRQSVSAKRERNVYDVQSGKKLNSLLQNGYSYKHQERRRYNVKPRQTCGISINTNCSLNASKEAGKNSMSGNFFQTQPDDSGKSSEQIFEQSKDSLANLVQEGPEAIWQVREVPLSTGPGMLHTILGNDEQVEKMKKLHLLYASQRAKDK